MESTEDELERITLLLDLKRLELQCVQLKLRLLQLRHHKRNNRNEKEKQKRTKWVRIWLLKRPQFGFWDNIQYELEMQEPNNFRNFHRIDKELFYEVLERIEHCIKKQDTNYRKAIEPATRLSIILRFLATGNSYVSLSYLYCVAHNTISKIVYETCEAIITEFMHEVVKCPTTPQEWVRVAKDYEKRWNYHNTLGALDGKHVAIKCPSGGGSVYYNYKGFHSIVMLALVDANYKFLYLDVGKNGASSDAGIFAVSELRKAIESNNLGVPASAPLPGSDIPVPFHIIADDAFPLRDWLMKPFQRRGLTKEERIFNYRLSRARRIVENAFGILANRFRCLFTTMAMKPERVTSATLACCILHNILMDRLPQLHTLADNEDPNTHELIEGSWRQDLNVLQRLEVHKIARGMEPARDLRNMLKDYYNSEFGSVSWQENMI